MALRTALRHREVTVTLEHLGRRIQAECSSRLGEPPRAAGDGNPRTQPEDGWTPLIPDPPYPEHPSGHTGLSGSIVRTLQQFFGTDRIGWSDTNNAGLTRSFSRLSQAIDEIVDARVWSGIHFRTADVQGQRISRQVARYRQRHYFQPVDDSD